MNEEKNRIISIKNKGDSGAIGNHISQISSGEQSVKIIVQMESPEELYHTIIPAVKLTLRARKKLPAS